MRRRPLATTALAAGALLAAGCDGHPATDNGRVTVYNETATDIEVLYDREIAVGDGAWIESLHERIAAGDHAVLFVDSWWWDGRLTVRWQGLIAHYDLDFDLLGFDTVHVHEEDFAPRGRG